jgi:hypothetical protein
MRRIIMTFIAAALLASSPVTRTQAQEPSFEYGQASEYTQELPLAFKGIALGSDIVAIERNPRFSCGAPDADAHRTCNLKYGETETIAGAPILPYGLWLHYRAGQLASIDVDFDPKDTAIVAAALREKYGAGRVRTETVKRMDGTTLERQVYAWRRDHATLELAPWWGVPKMFVHYRTDAGLAESARRWNAKTQQNAKDL